MDLPINLDIPWMVGIIITIIAGIEFYMLQRVVSLSRSYARMQVLKGRITADGRIVVTEKDIPEFVTATFTFMDQLEAILHWFFGYIINHPSTGWIRGYEPEIKETYNAAVTHLASTAPVSNYTVETVTEEPKEEPKVIGQPG